MAFDRNLLTVDQVTGFKGWLSDQSIQWRDGKGQWQLAQVKTDDGWGVITVDGKGNVSTQDSLRELIEQFKDHEPVSFGDLFIPEEEAPPPLSNHSTVVITSSGQYAVTNTVRDKKNPKHIVSMTTTPIGFKTAEPSDTPPWE